MSELLDFLLSRGEQFRRARLPSLWSDFTAQRQINTNGYIANLSTWEDAFCAAARAGMLPGGGAPPECLSLHTGPELLHSLELKDLGRPLALNAVINEAVSQGHMVPYQYFISSQASIYTRQWSHLPWNLVSWSLERLGLIQKTLEAGKLEVGQYVLLRNVEEAAAKVMTSLSNRSGPIDRLLTMSTFESAAAAALGLRKITAVDLDILLKYLSRDRRALAFDRQTIKLVGVDEKVLQITKEDRAIASLKALIGDITQQVKMLENQIESFKEKCQKAIRIKNRLSATAALKSKKAAESTLSQRLDTLSQLECVYQKIEQAADQIMLVRVLESSTAALRALNAKSGGTEKVEDVVDQLQEEMSKTEDIRRAIDEAGLASNIVDEDAIEDELETLIAHDREVEDAKEAEQTKKRLAEIQGQERTNDGQVERFQELETSPTKTSDAALIEDVSRLERMSLNEDDGTVPDQSTKEAVRFQKQFDAILEP